MALDSRFKVPLHDHDLTNIRGIADTHDALIGTSTKTGGGNDFSNIDDFKGSDNLYDDLVVIQT